jgi:hypothetical protein
MIAGITHSHCTGILDGIAKQAGYTGFITAMYFAHGFVV